MLSRHVYAIASTLEDTQRAVELAHQLANETHPGFAVIVPSSEHVTVSSARAHVDALP